MIPPADHPHRVPVRGRTRTRARSCAVAAFAVLALAALTGCGSDGDGGDDEDGAGFDPATTTVEYSFNDSSVAPEYHRSYTVTVVEGEARVVVDSYGDVLHDVTAPIDDSVWADTLAAAARFTDADDVTSEGCAGGTSEQLRVLDESGDAVVDVFIDNCGSSGGANIVEAVGSVLPLFDMTTLLATD